MRIWRMGAMLGALLAAAQIQAADQPAYDFVIRNGRVLDGEGNPWVRADIAILDGGFAKVGRVEGRGRRAPFARDSRPTSPFSIMTAFKIPRPMTIQ